MFPDFWTSDLVFRRMVVQLRRMAFLSKIYSPRGVDFFPPISKSSMGTPLFYFISWVYIYWITSVKTFAKIWVQVLFGWNDLKGSVTLPNFLSNLSCNGWKCSVASWQGLVFGSCYTVQFSQQLVSQGSSEPKNKKCLKLQDKLLEGWYTVQWRCQLLQSVAKSRAEFYFETTHVTMCNSPATCLATALRDKLLRKLQCNRALRNV